MVMLASKDGAAEQRKLDLKAYLWNGESATGSRNTAT